VQASERSKEELEVTWTRREEQWTGQRLLAQEERENALQRVVALEAQAQTPRKRIGGLPQQPHLRVFRMDDEVLRHGEGGRRATAGQAGNGPALAPADTCRRDGAGRP
jgi:hypothetical protein